MWLELSLVIVLGLSLLQSVLLFVLWRQSQRQQQHLAMLSHSAMHVCTDVPTSMLVSALGRLEKHLKQIEQQPAPTRQSYELAQQLAREGADAAQLVARCGLSGDEARLMLQMHAQAR